MKAELEKLATTPADAIDAKHAVSLILASLGSSLKGVHEERDYLAEDPETRVQACIARAATSQLQAPALFADGPMREWGHVHCTDNLKPYKKHKEKIKDLMRRLGLRLFICPEPLLSPSDYAAMFNANIVIATPASFVEQMAISLQFYELNPLSLFNRLLTLSCDLGADPPGPLVPVGKFRLFPYDDAVRFAMPPPGDLPGRSFRKPPAPAPLANHAGLSYGIDFTQFAAALEWNQRYLSTASPLHASNTSQNAITPLQRSSQMLGQHWITAPGYFEPRNFPDNVSIFMDRFGLDLEQKSCEEIERKMPELYRQTEQSLVSIINTMEASTPPLRRMIDFAFQRSVSAWIRPAYWQEFSKLWQALNRFVESGHGGGPGASTAVETCTQTLQDYETEFKRGLRDRLLESSLLVQK